MGEQLLQQMNVFCNLRSDSILFTLNFIDEGSVMEQYGDEVGLAALEWVDIFDPEYRRNHWMCTEEWFNDMTCLMFEKLEHPPSD